MPRGAPSRGADARALDTRPDRQALSRSNGTAGEIAHPQRGPPAPWTRNSKSSTGSWETRPGLGYGTPPTQPYSTDKPSLGRGGEHFDSVLREVAVVNSRATEWYSRRDCSSPEGAAGAMDKKVLRSWMIVVSTETVVRYVRRNYASGIVRRSRMAFLRDKA